MTEPKVGERVGAIASADETSIIMFGFGVRVEDEVPTDAQGEQAEMCKLLKRKNPCLLLDSGKKVYGCECWWGLEADIKQGILERKLEVKEADLDAERKLAQEALQQ